MSSEKDPYWQLKNGGGGMEGGGDNAAPAATEGNEFLPRKRLRSSGSYTDESINSAETSPKKVKVQIDSSFELSEKVQNNHQENSTSESDVKTATVPSEIVINNTKTSDEVVKDALSDTTAPEQSSKGNVLSSKSEEFFKKSVKQQVEELALEQGMETEYIFLKPPGYIYKIGQRAEPGDYEVCLSLAGEDKSEEKFCGVGSSPYEAIREASKKAREFLTSENGDCGSPNKSQEAEDCEKASAGCTLGEEEGDDLQDDKAEEVNGTSTVQDVEKDSDVYSGDSEGDEEEQEQPKWVHSLENFWDKALASKFPTISVDYSDKDPEGEEDVVECSIGKLVVEGTGSTKEIARENAAQYMFSLIENILENEGTETLKKNIIEGEDSEEVDDDYSTVNQPPFKDETAVETLEDEENYEDDYDEEYEEDIQTSKPTRNMVVEEEIIDSSSDESEHATSPQKHPEPAQVAPPEQMLPGAEYCLALTRVDMPDERPMVMDVPNMARRTRVRLAGQLVSSLRDGELSDDEEQEGSRMLDIVQQLLTMASTMSDRHKQKVTELFSRSGLGQVRPSLPMGGMPGMMAGMGGYAQYQQMYQQQAGYPGMPAGYPGGYPSQKMRLLAGQGPPAVQPQPEPPKPVQPLKNLCQFPLPGAIEGVGSVTVTLEDYKTLQVGTFLNDVIIDFYMKYLQFTQFGQEDKNRVHIFTTFWFSRLTNKPSPIEARKDPVQRRYDRVKRWTRKVNIFEKDFVVVPINENYHWYLCIICYPGMVGCQDVKDSSACSTPARQKNRRRVKDKIKVLKSKMNAKPRKDESDERDEPLASEDEVEHEDDSTDVELWKTKLSVWEREEALRKEEEKKRMIELEKQRREWEQRRREYEEQQRKLYEEQQRLMEEEELRLAMEQEEMGEEEENWDDGEKYDEDGNPVEEKYDEYGELITDRYDEFGDPIDYDETIVQEDLPCENGGFADAAKYKTSDEMVSANEVDIPVKARAMAADWDDWGEEEDEQDEEEMEQDMPQEGHVDIEDDEAMCSSMVAHATEQQKSTVVTSVANQLVTTKTVLSLTMAEDDESGEPKCFSSMVAHTVVWRKLPKECNTAAILHKLEQDKAVMKNSENCQDIPQVDGMVDEEGSDEEKVEAAEEEKDELNDEKKCEKLANKSDSCDGNIEKTDQVMVTEAEERVTDAEERVTDAEEKVTEAEEVDSPKGENGGLDESSMSTDDEVTLKKVGLVGYADTGDDTDTELDTDVEKTDTVPADVMKSQQDEDVKENAEELPKVDHQDSDTENVANGDGAGGEFIEKENSDVEMEVNSDSSDTEDYEKDVHEKRADSNIDERQSDSEIEELDVMEKEGENGDQDNCEDPSDRSESESEASESDDEEEDISRDVPVKQPCILVFDSLGGKKERQARLCATLRDFLALEFEEKYPGQKREFSTRTMPGSAPKVPQQPNLTDCGLYLCQNVETFFRNPIEDYTLPITSLGSWFQDSESRMKRSNVAGIIRKLGTQQNQDKLEQLQFPDLLFVEPEKVKPAQRIERRNSPGSDGDNMEDEYNSEDDYDEDDEEQGRSDRYSSSPNAKNRSSARDKDDRFSTEDDNSDDDEDRLEVDKNRKSDEPRVKAFEQSHEERRQKRYRSDDSGSDEDRQSRHQKRRNDRASSSESGGSDDDFDSSAVYGRPTPRPIIRSENNLNFDSSPMKKLPPGISISRAVESNNSRSVPQIRENTPQDQPEMTRRLPPGISISRTLNNPPAGLTISREKVAPPVIKSNIKSEEDDDPYNVTIEDVSDCSDDCELFDLDEPASTRTYLQPKTITTSSDQEEVTNRLFRLPPGVSISRGGAKDDIEDMSESDHGDSELDEDREMYDDKMNHDIDDPQLGVNEYHDDTMDNDPENGTVFNSSASMVAHQAALASIESGHVSMVAHQVFKEQSSDSVSGEKVPQLDGMNDFDSEDETNDGSAETLPVNQEATDPPIGDNPPEVSNDASDVEVPATEYNHSSQEEDDSVPPEVLESTNTNNEVNSDLNHAEVPSADDVDNIDNHGLEEGEEISPAESGIAETHEDIKTGEEFKNDSFDDGSNLQNAEEIEELDLGDAANAQEVYSHAQDANFPTEEAMDTYEDSELFEHGAEEVPAEDIDDQAEVDNAGVEEIEECSEGLNGNEEVINDGEEVIDDGDEETVDDDEEVLDNSAEVIDDSADVIDDGAEELDDSTEVYDEDDADVLVNNQEEYDYEEGEGEDDEMYEEDSYSYGYSQPPVKRSRMSSDAEVVLDSGDEDDAPTPAYPSHANPMLVQQNSSIHSQILAQQQAMMMAQTQLRPPYQPMAGQASRTLPPGLSLSHQHTVQPPQPPQPQHPVSRKRKLESAALCIKDGQVYLKPFTQLPAALLGRKPTNLNPLKPNPLHINPLHINPLKPNPQYTNPYKPLPVPGPGPNPYQPVLGVHQMSSQGFPQIASKQESHQASSVLQQRIRQLPPGIMVQRSEVREESRDSVEDDDEYQSDDPEEVIDGQEVEEDLDIIEDHSNKDMYSEEEEEESYDEVHDVNEQGNAYENENSKESNADHQEEILVSGSVEENENAAEVDVEFEEASVDIQEACEENDKDEVELENDPIEETSDKQSDLIEGEEVADCDESQKDNDGEPEAAEVAE